MPMHDRPSYEKKIIFGTPCTKIFCNSFAVFIVVALWKNNNELIYGQAIIMHVHMYLHSLMVKTFQ